MSSKANSLATALRRGNRVRFIVSLLLFLALAQNGCQLFHHKAGIVTAVVPGSRSGQTPDPALLQTEVLDFADSFSTQIAASLDEYALHMNTPEARLQALDWKLSISSSVLSIATGPNPLANLLDLVSLASLLRVSLEEQAPKTVLPGAFDDWLETSRLLETNAWTLAAATFTTNQQQQLRETLDRWRTENPTPIASFFARPQELTALVHQAEAKERRPGNVFSVIGLDPMSGLDPAVREVTRTRLFAERALFAAQRMPDLLRWQTELLSAQLLRQQQVTTALQSVDRLSRAAQSASQTAALLPDRISNERRAILDALETHESKLRDLSVQVGQTLTAGEKMSSSLNTTLITFDAVMKNFTNSLPFNILDYAHTAEQVTTMADRLHALFKDLDTTAWDKRLTQLDAISDRARDNAKSVLNHAFLLATGFLLLSFVCALLYRRVGRSSVQKPE
jgi:hypothetical protein